jgi:hypothetical protein
MMMLGLTAHRSACIAKAASSSGAEALTDVLTACAKN